MRFEIGCAAAVLMLFAHDVVEGGALRNAFSKKNKVEVTADESSEKINSERPEITETSAPETKNEAASAENAVEVAPAAGQSSDGKAEAKAELKVASDAAKDNFSKKPEKKIVGDPVVLRIGKTEIRRSQILAELKNIPPQLLQSDQISSDKIFEMLITQKEILYLFVDQAKKAGLDKTKEFIDQLDKLKERLLFEAFLVKEIGPKASSETALKAKYQQYLINFKSMKEVRLAHIMVNTEKEAKDIISALSKGTSFEKLQLNKAAHQETAESFIALQMLPENVRKELEHLKKGEATKNFIKIGEGYHIFKVVELRDSKPGSFDEVKPFLGQTIMKEEMDKLVARLEKQYKVEKFNEDGSPISK